MAGSRSQLLVAAGALMLATLAPVPAGAAPDLVRTIVPLEDTGRADLEAALADTGGQLLRIDETLGFAVVTTPRPDHLDARLEASIQDDHRAAESVQAGWLDAPGDPLYTDQWGPRYLEMHQAWGLEDGDPGVVVAVVDSGIDPGHPDIDPARVIQGHDYVEDDEVPQDPRGHGTHVAGIVAATRDNGKGIAGMAKVTIMAIRVLNATGGGFCSDVASGVREATDEGARVINLSLSCEADNPMLHDAIRYAHDNDVLVVAAAGNFWDDRDELRSQCVVYPARYPETVAVGSLDSYPALGGVTVSISASDFSCRGPEVELTAPGERILSTTDGGYAWGSGTSMAVPHVSATAALTLSAIPELTAEGTRDRLAATATDLGDDGRDETFGHGAIDPVRAVGGFDAVPGPG